MWKTKILSQHFLFCCTGGRSFLYSPIHRSYVQGRWSWQHFPSLFSLVCASYNFNWKVIWAFSIFSRESLKCGTWGATHGLTSRCRPSIGLSVHGILPPPPQILFLGSYFQATFSGFLSENKSNFAKTFSSKYQIRHRESLKVFVLCKKGLSSISDCTTPTTFVLSPPYMALFSTVWFVGDIELKDQRNYV